MRPYMACRASADPRFATIEYVNRRNEAEQQAIREYVAAQGVKEVTHLEKLNSQRIGPDRFDVWDVWTDEGRWYVITPGTNLYLQEDFQSFETALTFHVGLWHVLQARDTAAPTMKERNRGPAAWRMGTGGGRARPRGRSRGRLSGRNAPAGRTSDLPSGHRRGRVRSRRRGTPAGRQLHTLDGTDRNPHRCRKLAGGASPPSSRVRAHDVATRELADARRERDSVARNDRAHRL